MKLFILLKTRIFFFEYNETFLSVEHLKDDLIKIPKNFNGREKFKFVLT